LGMWRISPGGASAGRLTAVGSAGRRETSPFRTDAVTLEVDALLGQQPQSRHMSAQSPNGSSNEVEHGAESPKAADTIQASKRIAAKVVPGRLTQGAYNTKESGTCAQLLRFHGCGGRIFAPGLVDFRVSPGFAPDSRAGGGTLDARPGTSVNFSLQRPDVETLGGRSDSANRPAEGL